MHRQFSEVATHADLEAAVAQQTTSRVASAHDEGDVHRKLVTIEAELESHRRQIVETRNALSTKVRVCGARFCLSLQVGCLARAYTKCAHTAHDVVFVVVVLVGAVACGVLGLCRRRQTMMR